MANFEALILPLLLVAAGGYRLGSISFAIILTRVFADEDVRRHGSGNAGATNVLRVAGKKASALTFLCDFLKCALSVAIGYYALHFICLANGIDPVLARLGMYAAGLCCIIGHMYPLYFGFRGGVGVVTAAAMILLQDWRVFLICFAFFALVFAWKKTVSLASICGCLLYPIVTFFITFFIDYKIGGLPGFYVAMATAVAALIGATVIVKHRANIKRILAGEEKPISFKKES